MAHQLNLQDAMALARVIRASGMRGEIKTVMSKIVTNFERLDADDEVAKADFIQSAGMDGIMTVLECCSAAEKELFDFLGGILDMNPKEVKVLPIGETITLISAVFDGNRDNLSAFFNSLSALTGKN